MKLLHAGAAVAMLIAGTADGPAALAQTPPSTAKNVVFVHGAWADGSSWGEVIPILQAAGFHVTSVQNPLTTLAESDAAVRWSLAQQDGPTVLVGHSWAGTVISDVGTDLKVSALVYVAARAPDAGEDFVALSGKFATAPVRAGIETHEGITRLSRASFISYFANGVAPKLAETLYAEQGPTAALLFGDKTTVAAWRSKPTFYAVSEDDKTITPDLERFLAHRMGAKTIEIAAGHLSMVSHPQEIAGLIMEAAGAAK